MEPKRLNKFISDSGFCSRREADKLIEQGRVTINGKIPDPGAKVTAKDKVRIDDEILSVKDEAIVFLAFNKPAGIATTTDLSVRNNITSALNYPASLQPIGLLDRDAEGLMFLSNDTELARRMTKADTKFEKEYVVTVDKMITPDFLNKISEGGAPVPDMVRKKSFVVKEGPNRFRIVLEPHTNHHVKRMVEFLGYKVVHLQRIRIQDITLTKLPVRFWRKLTDAEITSLKTVMGSKGSKPKSSFQPDAGNNFEDNSFSKSRASSTKSTFNKTARADTKSAGSYINPKSKEARASRKPSVNKPKSRRDSAPKIGNGKSSRPKK